LTYRLHLFPDLIDLNQARAGGHFILCNVNILLYMLQKHASIIFKQSTLLYVWLKFVETYI